MSRHRAAPALALLGALLAGCQDYNFNPVGHCLITPGTERVTLSSISTADILFVVDDSGSMGGKQAKLAAAFDAFIKSLDAYNQTRVASALQPFEFHIGITTTSVFYNPPAPATCQATCGSASNVCCLDATTQPMAVPVACPAGNECGAGFACKTSCVGHDGEAVCCDAGGATLEKATVPCSTPGARCGGLQKRFVFPREAKTCTSSSQCTDDAVHTSCVSGCGGYLGDMCCTPPVACTVATDCNAGYVCGSCGGLSGVCCWGQSPTHPQGQPEFVLACQPGIAEEGTLYPHGSFVGLGTNPRVLHFDRGLYGTLVNGTWTPVPDPATATNGQGFTRRQLIDFFTANVNVGTCGSGQEQGLQAGRLAIARALEGRQLDMRDGRGAIVPAPGVTAEWLHAGAKLVVVYIGDEDDCGSPEDPFRGVILAGTAGADTCVDPALGVTALGMDQTPKEFLVSDVVGDLQRLGRPLGAAFIVATAQPTCVDAACTPGLCCDHQCTGSASICRTATCGGQGAGSRLLAAAGELRGGGVDVVEGSMCDPGARSCGADADCATLAGSTCVNGCGGATGSFCCTASGTLAGTAGFAPILSRIAEIVKPPSALLLPTQPADASVALLRILAADGKPRKTCNGPALPPLTFQQARDQGYDWWFTASQVQITDAQKQPAPASRYVYLNHDTRNCEANPGETYSADYLGRLPEGGCLTDADCAAVLGSGASDWTCFAGVDAGGKCLAPTASAVGTCLCGGRARNCPAG